MSEEGTPNTQPAAPTIPQDVLDRITTEAATRAAEAATKEAEKVATAKSKEAVTEYRQSVAEALGLAPGQDKKNEQILDIFLRDPQTFVQAIVDKTTSVTQEQLNRRDLEARTYREEERQTKAVLKDRPDITTSQESMDAIADIYEALRAQDDDSSHEDLLKKAIKKHDVLLERAGAGKAEDRIKASMHRVPGSSSATDVPSPQASAKERTEASMADYQKSRVERFKQLHGGQYRSLNRQ